MSEPSPVPSPALPVVPNPPGGSGPVGGSAPGAGRADAVGVSRVPRRVLFASAGAVAATLGVAGKATAAPAAAPTTAWALGGNANVATDGTNFLGPKNSAPLIFKTVPPSGSTPVERVRITPKGAMGIGVTSPTAKLDVATNGTDTGVRGTNTGPSGNGVEAKSTNGIGLVASGSYAGVSSSATSYGGIFLAGSSGTGVYGSGSYGVYGAGGSYGVFGTGTTYGVRAMGGSYGLYGTGSTNGVYGQSSGTGIAGYGGSIGVYGAQASSAGVRGDSTYVGVWGTGQSWGVYAQSTVNTGQVYGVYGATDSPAGFGLYSDGNAHVNGTLSKSAGSFRIDHPLDPDHRWLSHSFVESPDMMNVYNGNVTTGSDGRVSVTLPDYFHALNRDFRYQLTVLGTFAQAIVSRRISRGSFEIHTDKPHVEVSWQVTGIRQDAYAAAHPIVVDAPKSTADRGTRDFVATGVAATRTRRPVAHGG